MKFILILFLSFSTIGSISAQKKAYVCTPCGYDCDKMAFSQPGKCGSCGMVLVDETSIKFSSLTSEALCARAAANPKIVLLDVRSPAEFNGTSSDVPSFGHFKNAININVTELESRAKELDKYKDSEVIVYCSHSHRSPAASYYLSLHGFKNVKNMSGGVSTLPAVITNPCLKEIYVAHQDGGKGKR